MLARVKWRGDRWNNKGDQRIVEYGTLLAIVGTVPDTYCYIAMDGHNPDARGKIVRKSLEVVTVTTFFNWMGEGR